jgi:hypothetical protein
LERKAGGSGISPLAHAEEANRPFGNERRTPCDFPGVVGRRIVRVHVHPEAQAAVSSCLTPIALVGTSF